MSSEIKNCRVSGKPLQEVINLGDLYVSNFLPKITESAPRGPLRIGIESQSGLLQLMDSLPREDLYKTYWYRSGTNAIMRRQLTDILRTASEWAGLRDGDIVLDIGCNDGTLLSLFPGICNVHRVGIDPAENLSEEAKQHAESHAVAPFDKTVFRSLVGDRKAKVITSIAMFYGIDEPMAFASDVRDCLSPDGIWLLQLSYTPLMLKQNAFDNICHEHIEYYTFESLSRLFDRVGLKIVDVEFNDTNAGSFRLVITHADNPMKDTPLFVRDIGAFRTESAREYEQKHRFDDPAIYQDYMGRLQMLKSETRNLLQQLKEQGKRVCAYGASTKGNTLLQFYGLGPEWIVAAAERQKQKWGLLTAGSWIPIVSESEMRAMKPDYLLVLPWHFIHEFCRRENEFLARGGKFIIPLPQLQIYP